MNNNVDFHTHILPAIDDGAKDVEESKAMLSAMKAQGINKIIATSHFLPYTGIPDDFVLRRAEAKEKIKDITDRPEIYLGAEVEYFPGMGKSFEMRKLCIEGTNFIMIEMPFQRWDTGVINDLLDVYSYLGCTPIIAHIDRYYGYQTRKTLFRLRDNKVLFQLNASAVIEHPHKAIWYIKNGFGDILGSDAHNMTDRKPQLSQALAIIEKKLGPEYFDNLWGLSDYILKNAISF